MTDRFRIGTRKSELALWQANFVADALRRAYPDAQVELVTHVTQGDTILDQPLAQIGGKGLFTAELEAALLAGDIDCAVHSLKDLPTESPAGLTLGAVTERASVNDVLISQHGLMLEDLPQGASIGTSSLRRASQLRMFRGDFNIIDIRGNVPTRIDKVFAENSPYDAIILAQAGVERLNLSARITQILPLELMLPAPGQGALAVQCREGDDRFATLTHLPTLAAVTAERAFLSALGGGCAVPVAAYATLQDGTLFLRGRVGAVDGSQTIDVEASKPYDASFPQNLAQKLGQQAGQSALANGAKSLLVDESS